MSRLATVVLPVLFSAAICFAASADVEVLYVVQPADGGAFNLLTYNVDPASAVAHRVGPAVTIPTNLMDTLTLNGKHLLYVYNTTDVWLYVTDGHGVPQGQAIEDFKFNLRYGVARFLVDPNGKFAYAGSTWTDYNGYNAGVTLFTVNQSTGRLTNTRKVVATYGPSVWVPVGDFIMGSSGEKLYEQIDSYFAPFTCGLLYDYFPVSQVSGRLGSATVWVGWATAE